MDQLSSVIVGILGLFAAAYSLYTKWQAKIVERERLRAREEKIKSDIERVQSDIRSQSLSELVDSSNKDWGSDSKKK